MGENSSCMKEGLGFLETTFLMFEEKSETHTNQLTIQFLDVLLSRYTPVVQ